MIDSYSFGRIIVNGRSYANDIIINPEGVKDHWWRMEGHRLLPEDLPLIFTMRPDILIIGSGASGMMKIAPETKAMINEKGIELIIATTRAACKEYNRLIVGSKKVRKEKERRVVAALHLTC